MLDACDLDGSSRGTGQRGKQDAFGYVTRTVWTAFLQILKDHYKHLNIKKSLFEKILAQTDDEFAKNQLLEWQRNEWKDGEDDD